MSERGEEEEDWGLAVRPMSTLAKCTHRHATSAKHAGPTVSLAIITILFKNEKSLFYYRE